MSHPRWKSDVRAVYTKGYRVTDEGRFVNPRGVELTVGRGAKYPTMGYWDGKRVVTVPLHKLAAFCFFGEPALSAPCVRHSNGNRLDLSRDNIKIGSYSDNEQDKPLFVRKRSATIATHSTKHYLNAPRTFPGEKICRLCRRSKSLQEFGPQKEAEDGRAYRCRSCKALVERERRAKCT